MTQPNAPHQNGEDLRTDIASDAYTAKIASECEKSPSICVVEAVAEALDTDPMALQPLSEAIDPDGLNRLLESPHRFRSGRLRFRFEGCTVTVDADGRIAVSHQTNNGR